jgi:chromosomal replication initiation ATPase DnaA
MTLSYQPGSIPGYGAPLKTVATYAGLTGKDYFRAVLADVAALRGVKGDDITGPSRLRELVHARQEVAWKVRQAQTACFEPRFSLSQIGTWLGGRDHTTIIHAIRAHEKRRGGQG